ncbi:IucA/IucC family C-terminal-domain containing protein [Bacillus solitudinis]|uniref:IucA/IucC family C-terminal-domain containing protein n=1 Tax=Bacillus solitudinis TaxID=2014074 RepID=UPI000C24A951|nr:IucA/IucC family C-terminal-domain containing protein [Bacillus solitudinis]
MFNHQLVSDEKQSLSEFRLCFRKGGGDSCSIPIQQLFNRQELTTLMTVLQQKMQASNEKITASIFSKRYSFVMVVPVLYSFSVLNKKMNIAKDNLFLEPSQSQDHWLPQIYLVDQTVNLPSGIEEREVMRRKLVNELFKNHLTVLWNELVAIWKIPKQILWENTAIYLIWLYESLLKKDYPETTKQRIKADFDFLLSNAEAPLFGEFSSNPINPFYHEKKIIDGNEIRVRKTCCFSFYVETKKMCKTCPRICH